MESPNDPISPLRFLSYHLTKLPVRKYNDHGKRASVVALIRVSPSASKLALYEEPDHSSTVDDFLAQAWVAEGTPEVLFCRRAINPRDRWSGHVAWPGGRQEPSETDHETAVRETHEEVGIDLSDTKRFLYVGELDQREVRGFAGREKWMTVCCFVYFQIVPATPPLKLQESEMAEAFWVPLAQLRDIATRSDPSSSPHWRPITYDMSAMLLDNKVARRLAKNWGHGGRALLELFRILAGLFFGKVSFGGIELSNSSPKPGTSEPKSVPQSPVSSSPTPGMTDSLEFSDIGEPEEDRLVKSMNLSLTDSLDHGTATESGWFNVSSSKRLSTASSAPSSQAGPVKATGDTLTTDQLKTVDVPPVLWGLTLWMTSDLIDLTFPPENVPPFPLHYHTNPKFGAWDVQAFMKLVHRESSGLHRRKPMRNSTRADGEDSGDLIPLGTAESVDGGEFGESAGESSVQISYAVALQVSLVASLVTRLTFASLLLWKAKNMLAHIVA
ncbi:NUDIX-domain-containing protein [Gonapodya prolifera JEL478]|uniref:NUDIX-domain-containing protein n=1 Tax=Gonapodya prolifera (strain JEL478) TaxID=1344416 RepID=A0A139AN93_GONPJ|nr:NUDIX-domain-containing protein [Gonapodya prolifera JEL478]|eukprot:KXS17975.1 NUDIX-domain-containing protein [Gonapodya prolifera JEL478]